MWQELECDLHLANDRHTRIARGLKGWRVWGHAWAGHHNRAPRNAREIVSAVLHLDAKRREVEGGTQHRVAGARVARVHVGARPTQQLSHRSAAACESDHADLTASPGGGQCLCERTNRHASGP